MSSIYRQYVDDLDGYRYPPRSRWIDHTSWFSRVVTAPTGLAVSLAQVRERLRLDANVPADDLTLMIQSAQAWWEGETGMSLMSQVEEVCYPGFPWRGEAIPLYLHPLRGVTTVKYYDLQGVQQTLAGTAWRLVKGDKSGVVENAAASGWPETEQSFAMLDPGARLEGVTIRVSTGYLTASAVPADIQHALLLHIGTQYRYREAVVEGSPRGLPYGLKAAAQRYRLDFKQEGAVL